MIKKNRLKKKNLKFYSVNNSVPKYWKRLVTRAKKPCENIFESNNGRPMPDYAIGLKPQALARGLVSFDESYLVRVAEGFAVEGSYRCNNYQEQIDSY